MHEHRSTPDTIDTDMDQTSRKPVTFRSGNTTGGSCFSPRIFCYGLSRQGTSHMAGDVPCQDSNGLGLVEKQERQYLITAVADGVGSCILSHEGSRTAVQTAVSHCEAALQNLESPTDQDILQIIRQAFSLAWDAIEAQALEMNQLLFSFYTTLTLTVYDGEKLHIGHIGDGGVVALFHDGSFSLVTKRHKGESATSVYPLQSGEANWQFLTVAEPVSGFAVATDGVLDSFVLSKQYDNMVFAPFLTEYLFQDFDSSQKLQAAATELDEFLRSDAYLERVSDDITLFIAGNADVLRGQTAPPFDRELWSAKIRAVDERLRAQTYQPQQVPVPEPPERKKTGTWKRVYEYFAGSFRSLQKKEAHRQVFAEKSQNVNTEGKKENGTASGKNRKDLHNRKGTEPWR